MTALFDLDALEVEANGTPFPFRLHGHDFTLPGQDTADWRALAALDRGDYEDGLRSLLGDTEYATFIASKMSSKKLEALLTAYLKHLGSKPGESSASTGS